MGLLSLIIAFITYIAMIVVNGLANALPLNGITTGDVSFKYPNLFQPSGITFSIWGIIYLLLFIYLGIQAFNVNQTKTEEVKKTYTRTNLLFSISSILNTIWLFTWHYDYMFLSTVIILMLLITLILLVKTIPSNLRFIKAIFSVYLGWITVASIANITILLVKLGLQNEGIVAVILTVLVLLVGTIISLLWIVREKDYIFGFVIVWAYLGILIRHLTQENLERMYPTIVTSVIILMICLIFTNTRVLNKTLHR